jgi:hypothetical protein
VPTIFGGVANFKARLTLWSGAAGVAWSPSVGVGGTPARHAPTTAAPTTGSGHGIRGATRGAMRLVVRVLFEAQ